MRGSERERVRERERKRRKQREKEREGEKERIYSPIFTLSLSLLCLFPKFRLKLDQELKRVREKERATER